MYQEVNGIVYFAGKEKAIVKGFFGDTVNPEIVLLFINKGGLKYYINYENILIDKSKKTDVSVGKFYELKRAEKGRKLIMTESKKSFDINIIEEAKKDSSIQKNIEFSKVVVEREITSQLRVKKIRNRVAELLTLLIIIIMYAFSKRFAYAIPFIIGMIITIIYLIVYIKKTVRFIKRI